MAWRFVLQPNKLLGLFSDIVDDFTYLNLTVEEAIKVSMEERHLSEVEALQKVERGLKDEKPWTVGVYGDGQARWKHCLEAIKRVHGAAVTEKRAQDGTFKVLHYLTQDNQPYGSESRKCSECGVMIWGKPKPLHTDDHSVWLSPPAGHINCRKKE